MLLSNTDPGKSTTLSLTKAFQNYSKHCREKQGERNRKWRIHANILAYTDLASHPSFSLLLPEPVTKSAPRELAQLLRPGSLTCDCRLLHGISHLTTHQTSWFSPSKIQRGRFPLCSWLRAYPGSGFWTYFLAKEERAHPSGEPSPSTLTCMETGALPLES